MGISDKAANEVVMPACGTGLAAFPGRSEEGLLKVKPPMVRANPSRNYICPSFHDARGHFGEFVELTTRFIFVRKILASLCGALQHMPRVISIAYHR